MDFTMRIGIIGTSHSQGRQPYTNNLKEFFKLDPADRSYTEPLEYHLKRAMPEHEFFNVACSGRGTERYLSCITHLKNTYSVQAILMEYNANREPNAYWSNETVSPYIFDVDKHKFVKDYIENNSKYISSINGPTQVFGVPEKLSRREIQAWKDMCALLFHDSKGTRLRGLVDIQQSWDLCKLLDIAVIPWEFKNHSININRNFMPFIGWLTTTDIPKDQWYCDGHHATDSILERAAVEYFKPLVDVGVQSLV